MTVQKKNSDVIRHVLRTLVNISGRKTTEGYAVSIMDSLIKKLEEEYDFLKHVEIRDTRFLEDDYSVSVMSDVDFVSPAKVGKAIHDIIISMNKSLGKNAGYFLIKELSRSIGDIYQSTMNEMGIDLGLMQLEHEVSELEKRVMNTRKTE